MEYAEEKKIVDAIKVLSEVLSDQKITTQQAYDVTSSIEDLAGLLKCEYNKRLVVLMRPPR